MRMFLYVFFFFFKQKTAYEMRISDWSSDVCSSDLKRKERKPHEEPCNRAVLAVSHRSREAEAARHRLGPGRAVVVVRRAERPQQIGRASCRERVCQYG